MTKPLPLRHEFPESLTWNLSQVYPDSARQTALQAVLAAIEKIERLVVQSEGIIAVPEALQAIGRSRQAGQLVPMLVAYTELAWLVDTSDQQGVARLNELKALPLRGHEAQVNLLKRIGAEGNLAEFLARIGATLGADPTQLEQQLRGQDLSHLTSRGEASLQAHAHLLNRKEVIEAATSLASKMARSLPPESAQALQSPDRQQRQQAHRQRIEHAHSYGEEAAVIFNTLATSLLAETTQSGASSIMRHQMRSGGMPPDLYALMLTAIHSRTSIFDRLTERRRQVMGLPQLEAYDLNVPLDPQRDFGTWSEGGASQLVTRACAVIGSDYSLLIGKYLDPRARMVDWPNNHGKHSQPVCRVFGGLPFISLPFDGSYHSLVDLAHELGHALHQLLTLRNKCPLPTQFTGEVAAAVHEVLVTQFLVATAPSPGHAEFYLKEALRVWMSRILAQSLAAEFEFCAYELFEQSNGAGVSAQELGALYLALSRDYLGDAVILNDDYAHLWLHALPLRAWNPCNGYLYPCAMAMALSIARTLSAAAGNPAATGIATAYTKFLAAGSSRSAPDLFAELGRPLTTTAWFEEAFKTIEESVSKLGY